MKFIALGPDDIPIREKPFKSREDAARGIEKFVERFRLQGYYAGVGYRLEIGGIAGRCRIKEVKKSDR